MEDQTLGDKNRRIESIGVHAVGLRAAKLGFLFREVLKHDKGIDAEIELTTISKTLTPFVALQIKSTSEFCRTSNDHISIRIKDKRTISYWRKYGRPVLLMVCSNDEVYWTRVDNAASQNIKVSLKQKFDEDSVALIEKIIKELLMPIYT